MCDKEWWYVCNLKGIHNSVTTSRTCNVHCILIVLFSYRASLGTTKYCSHFLAGLTCPKSVCVYVHVYVSCMNCICVRACVYACMHVCSLFIHLYVSMYIHMFMYVCVVCVCACAYVHAFVWLFMNKVVGCWKIQVVSLQELLPVKLAEIV